MLNKVLKYLNENKIYLLILLFVILLRLFVYSNVRVDGDSMYPTLKNNDMLIVDKMTYDFTNPKYDDIVVFDDKNSKDKFIKRVMGVPGDEIDIWGGKVIRNGEILDEPYINGVMADGSGDRFFPIVLGEGEYFVMGDNRNYSLDSRFNQVGNITKKEMMGKVFIRIYPLNKFGIVKGEY